MEQDNYKVLDTSGLTANTLADALNHLAARGYEVVAASDGRIILKKPARPHVFPNSGRELTQED